MTTLPCERCGAPVEIREDCWTGYPTSDSVFGRTMLDIGPRGSDPPRAMRYQHQQAKCHNCQHVATAQRKVVDLELTIALQDAEKKGE